MTRRESSAFEKDDAFGFLALNFDLYASTFSVLVSLRTPSSHCSGTPPNDEPSPLLATPVAGTMAPQTRIESPYVTRSCFPERSSPNFLPSGWDAYAVESVIKTPNAPMMKDLDSFTDGTGAGSFADFIDEEEEEDDALVQDAFYSQQQPHNFNSDIESWRKKVDSSSEGNAPWVGCTDLPEDPLHTEAIQQTEALLGGIGLNAETTSDAVQGEGDEDSIAIDDGDDGSDIGPDRPSASSLVPPMSAPATLTFEALMMTPRVMKRARSQSPASQLSRHVRTRSPSSFPPWRLPHPFKD
ncbi:hypothetical protein H0H92_015633 [Tricholoma furcatifolium]|nr:hypothetical protein H0H92_015633 [Tricholoma furcatifolium]